MAPKHVQNNSKGAKKRQIQEQVLRRLPVQPLRSGNLRKHVPLVTPQAGFAAAVLPHGQGAPRRAGSPPEGQRWLLLRTRCCARDVAVSAPASPSAAEKTKGICPHNSAGDLGVTSRSLLRSRVIRVSDPQMEESPVARPCHESMPRSSYTYGNTCPGALA